MRVNSRSMSHTTVLDVKDQKLPLKNGTVSTNALTNVNTAVKIDISEQGRKVSAILKLKFDIGSIPASDLGSSLVEEFLVKYEQYEAQGLFANVADNNSSNQLLQNSILDLVDEYSAKAANDMCQSDLKAMSLRTKMAMSLVDGLGITSGHVDWSEKGVAKMIELVKQKLGKGTLNSPHAEMYSLDAFNEFYEKYNRDVEAAQKAYDTNNLLKEKLEEIKNSFVNFFEGSRLIL